MKLEGKIKLITIIVGIILFLALLYMGLIFFIKRYPEKTGNIAYNISKKSMTCQECIKHFPDKMPTDMQNVHFVAARKTKNSSEKLLLQFDASEDYIQNEIKKYKYKDVENWDKFDYYPIMYHVFLKNNLSEERYTFYLIDDAADNNDGYGIAANDHSILYFHYIF